MSILPPNKDHGFNFSQSSEPSTRSGNAWLDGNGVLNIKTKTAWFNLTNRSLGREGYLCGGKNTSYTSDISKFSFPFDSGVVKEAGKTNNYHTLMAWCNSSKEGFIFNGHSSSVSVERSTCEKIGFPFDSGTAIVCAYSAHEVKWTSGCNSSNYGYNSGGYYNHVSYIQRMTFPMTTNMAVTGNLNNTVSYHASYNSSIHGYIQEGYYTRSNCERITFPFDSGNASLITTADTGGYTGNAANSSLHGFFSVGVNSSIRRTSFPFDSGTSSLYGNLVNQNHRMSQGFLNSTKFGFIVGGKGSSATSSVSKLDFSLDSGNINSIGNLTSTWEEPATPDGTDFCTMFL